MSTRVSIGWPITDRREIAAVMHVLKQGRLSQGPFVRAFEDAWARAVGRRTAIAANSGSSANLIALLAVKERYGWKDGDFVAVPALTFATAVMPVLQAGLRPLWVDVDERGNMTLEALEHAAAGAKRLRGIVLVHSLGVPCLDAPKIVRWARRHRIRILEDGCESHGAKVGKTIVGGFGDASTTSFYVAHNMTAGEGGMIATDDAKLADLCRSIREFGRRITNERFVKLASGSRYDVRYAFDRLGYNLRMTDLHAAIGMVQLEKLPAMNRKRRAIVAAYWRAFGKLIRDEKLFLPEEPKSSFNTYYALQVTLRQLPPGCRDAADVAAALERVGVETRRFMGGNLLRQYAFLGQDTPKPDAFPVADFLHNRALLIGCHPAIKNQDIKRIARVLEELYYRRSEK
ncbi:DegT/DnrJ/EryC1/StrS family aminotransferase [Candidatus Parcubacteria bacterium]|nr:MAG: DegT/DnrJ/EryC1/StrS family aminotransferase [Candidatus Parcubacteria bacterium]